MKASGAPSIGDIVRYQCQNGAEEYIYTALVIGEKSIWVEILPFIKSGQPAPKSERHWVHGPSSEMWIKRENCRVLNLNNRNH